MEIVQVGGSWKLQGYKWQTDPLIEMPWPFDMFPFPAWSTSKVPSLVFTSPEPKTKKAAQISSHSATDTRLQVTDLRQNGMFSTCLKFQ